MIKSCFLVLLFSLSWAISFAQLNESDTIRFQLRGSASGNYQQGNVEVFTLRSKIDVSYSPSPNWVIKSQNSSLYQSFYAVEADNDLFSRNYLYYKPQHLLYPFAIAYVSTNYRRKISNRYFAGAGATVQVANTAATVLKLSLSAVYEATKFTQSTFNQARYNTNDNIHLWRATLYMGGWNYLLKKHLRLYYDAFWQPAFNNTSNYRTQFDVGADMPIWNGWAFNIAYAFTHENVVIEKIKQEDKILTFGFAYSIKKK